LFSSLFDRNVLGALAFSYKLHFFHRFLILFLFCFFPVHRAIEPFFLLTHSGFFLLLYSSWCTDLSSVTICGVANFDVFKASLFAYDVFKRRYLLTTFLKRRYNLFVAVDDVGVMP
jgi:hypothetical protein